jgi:hypothetical protein
MLSNKPGDSSKITPSNESMLPDLSPLDIDTQFSSLPGSSDPRIDFLMHQVRRLPVHYGEEFRFVDYDNTLSDDEWRFVVCPKLRQNRWDLAYAVIRQEFGGFKEYVDRLKPNEHLLDYSHFYDPSNPNHIILTAWDEELQRLKIENSGFDNAQKIIVDDAEKKILAIIQYILARWYIPGRIVFIDDKINNFRWKDVQLTNILGIEVLFYRAIPTPSKAVLLENISASTQSRVATLLRA